MPSYMLRRSWLWQERDKKGRMGAQSLTPHRSRGRGSIDVLPSGAHRVRVYAGIDPLTGQRNYLTEVIPPGPGEAKEAEKTRTGLLSQVDERRNPAHGGQAGPAARPVPGGRRARGVHAQHPSRLPRPACASRARVAPTGHDEEGDVMRSEECAQPIRVLATGSRTWTRPDAVWRALGEVIQRSPAGPLSLFMEMPLEGRTDTQPTGRRSGV